MKPCTLLVVDDEEENIESIKRALHSEKDFTILGTTSPREALGMFQTDSGKIHILITDQRMPELSGTELLGEVVKISPDTIRIILTAYTDVQEILDAINLGHVYSYIIKPWNPEELRTIVQQACFYYQLREENRFLARELQQKNEELLRKNEELEKFNQVKTKFMVVASHELRTPATIITSALELLSEQKPAFQPEHQKLLQNALNGVRRLNEIIESFFESGNWNQIQAGIQVAPVDVKLLLIQVVSDLKSFFEKRQVELGLNLGTDLLVMGDRRKLYLVFENLLGNALKYTPDMGKVVVNAHNRGENVEIIFRDTGIGIPADELENIFDTFYQLENVQYHHTSRHEFMGGGTGLGLSMCRSIIQVHQGKIWAESKGKNQGSTFHVTLPLYPGESGTDGS